MATSGTHPIAPFAILDRELRAARGVTLGDWLAAHAFSPALLHAALRGGDPHGVLDALAEELGVSASALPRAA